MIGRREFLAGTLGSAAAACLRGAGPEIQGPGPSGLVLGRGIYAGFGHGEKWVQIGPEIAVDSRFGEGMPSLRMTSTNGRAAGAECALGAPPAKLLQADVYVEDPASCSQMEMLLTSNGTGWLAKVTKKISFKTGWNRLQFSINDCVVQGTGMTLNDWDRVTKVRLYFISKPGAKASIWVGPIQWLRTKAAITFTFDDGRTGCHTNAMPILATYDWAATLYCVTDGVGKRTYRLADSDDVIDPLTLDQLHSLQDNGWDIASHCVTHRDLIKATTAQKQYEMEASKEWLVKNGFSQGARFFATPYGHRDAETQVIASTLYENLRDASISIGFETPLSMDWGVDTRYQLRTQTVETQSRTTPQKFQNWVDRAVGSGTWLILVCHAVDNPSGWLDPDLFRKYLQILDSRRDQIDVVTMSQYWDRRKRALDEFSLNTRARTS